MAKDEHEVQRAQERRPPRELRAHAQAALVPAMGEREYEAFREDVQRRGLLVPLEITTAGVVLDGRQRLRAARELALPEVPVRLVAPEQELDYMLRAALFRRDLSPAERAALALELLPYDQLRGRAQERQRANLRQASEVATLPPRGERTRETLARLAGVSPRLAQDVLSVYEHDRPLFERVARGQLAAHRAAERVRQAHRDAALPAAPPLPDQPHQIIYADPPWQLGSPEGDLAPERHYPTMPLPEIKALPVPAADDSLLLLWTVTSLLPQALEVITAWGFHYVSAQIWVKPSIGPGNWVRHRHEQLLWARRGRFPLPPPGRRPDSVISAPRGRHSQKPDRFYEQIERAYPHMSKLELFARQPRPGWTAWGNQIAQ
jgi:N6-adenosine-specific RNA methylase IME4/ParB-like chromosome segregation protein Spo0J